MTRFKVTEYIPGFVDGYDAAETEVDSLESVLGIPWLTKGAPPTLNAGVPLEGKDFYYVMSGSYCVGFVRAL